MFKKNYLTGILFFIFFIESVWAYAENYVLVINPTEMNNTWVEALNLEFQKNMRQYGNWELKYETGMQGLKSYLNDDSIETPLGVIVVGDSTWSACKSLLSEKWEQVPVVRCRLLISSPLQQGETAAVHETNPCLVIENPIYLDETIQLMRKLEPETKKLAFISDAGSESAAVLANLEDLLKRCYYDIELEQLSANRLSTEQLMDTLSTYGPTVGLLYHSWSKRRTDSYIEKHFEDILFTSAHSPIYTLTEIKSSALCYVGGYYVSAEALAQSCLSAMEQLIGAKENEGGTDKVGGTPHAYLNYSVLKWLGVDSKLYPSDAVYLNRPLNFWEKYWIGILLAIVVLLGGLLWKGMALRKERKKRNLLNQYLLYMLESPIYMVNGAGEIVQGINEAVKPGDALSQNLASGKAFSKLFVDEKEFERYVRLIKFVIWTGKTREKIIRLQGSENDVRFVLTRIVRCEQERALILFSDVSEKERARRKSDEYYFFLKTILEKLPISIFVKDMNDHGRFMVWNERMSRDLGVSFSEVKGRGEEVLPESLKPIVEWGYGKDQELNGKPVATVLELDTDAGRKVMMVQNTLITYRNGANWQVGSVVDLTEHEKRKKELELLNRRHELTLKAMCTMPWTWNLQDGEFECDCEYVSDIYPIEKGVIHRTGEAIFDLILPEYIDMVKGAYERLISGDTSMFNEEFQIRYPGYDAPLWVESFAIAGRKNALGRPIELIGTSTIINERKRMEQELITAKEKAEEANKMKSAFLANMTHEIRTPLNAITGFSSLLVATNDTPENKELNQVIEHNSRILLKLVSDVLDITKIESGAMDLSYKKIDVNASLADFINSFKSQLPEGVEILFRPAMESCFFYIDDVRLLQVLSNYVTNAIKNTQQGAIIVGYRFPLRDCIRFFVRDTGIGIPAEKQTLIFERFIKLDNYKQGTGLGLSICKMIAECMGGKVGVDSREGEGAEFWFDLPYRPTV